MWWDGKNDCDQFSCCTSRPDQLLWQWVGPTLVYSLNQRVCFDMQIWPWASFQLTPSETWVGSRNTSVNLTWPDLEDFGVIPALGRVDSHVRREVAGGLRRADAGQHWIAPGAGGGGWIERWKERELNREGGIMWAGESSGGKKMWHEEQGSNLWRAGLEGWSCPWVLDHQPLHVFVFFKAFFSGTLTIVVLEVSEFWQLCSKSCDGGLEGRVCVCLCVVWRSVGDVEILVCAYTSTGIRDTCNNNQIYAFDLSNWARCTFSVQCFFFVDFLKLNSRCRNVHAVWNGLNR